MKFHLHHHDAAVLARRRKWSLMWALLVLAWSLLRTLVVWAAVGDYGLNPWIYLVIDLASASVDAVTTPRMVLSFVDGHHRRAIEWALISLGAFVVPDIYIFAGTQRLVIVGVITLTFVGGIWAVVRKVKKATREREALAAANEGAVGSA
jgi:cbb3-type cytochrome oxidase subunit 3